MSRKLVKVLAIKDGYMDNGEQFCKKGEYYNVIEGSTNSNGFKIRDRQNIIHSNSYKFALEYYELIYDDNEIFKSICNNCSEESPTQNIKSNLFHNFNVKFQYRSQFDTDQCKFTLCEKCLLDIMDKFQIKVEFEDSGEFKW